MFNRQSLHCHVQKNVLCKECGLFFYSNEQIIIRPKFLHSTTNNSHIMFSRFHIMPVAIICQTYIALILVIFPFEGADNKNNRIFLYATSLISFNEKHCVDASGHWILFASYMHSLFSQKKKLKLTGLV